MGDYGKNCQDVTNSGGDVAKLCQVSSTNEEGVAVVGKLMVVHGGYQYSIMIVASPTLRMCPRMTIYELVQFEITFDDGRLS